MSRRVTKSARPWLLDPDCAVFAWTALCVLALEARAEIFASVSFGGISTANTDVRWTGPNATELTFRGVTWDGRSFESPIYYGLKLGWWFSDVPRWGIAVDFTHAKMLTDLNQVVSVDGIRDGAAVSGAERLGETFQSLEFSHGHNLLMVGVQHRWLLGEPGDGSWWSHLLPFVGTGAGIALPHAEVATASGTISEYQWTGPAWQGSAGLHVAVAGPLSLFAEYKATFARLDVDTSGGGTLEVAPWGHHLAVGVTMSPGRGRSRTAAPSVSAIPRACR